MVSEKQIEAAAKAMETLALERGFVPWDEAASVALTAAEQVEPVRWAGTLPDAHKLAMEYEFRGDNGDYTPTEAERVMLEDFGNCLLSEIEPAPAARSGVVKVNHHTGGSAMHELPRDLVTILRTEAKNQRTPPIDYVIAEDGGRMVHTPEPDIAMAELLEEAAARLAKALEALEPFAMVAEHDISEDETDSDAFRPMPKPFNHAPQITVGHLRAARRALEGGE